MTSSETELAEERPTLFNRREFGLMSGAAMLAGSGLLTGCTRFRLPCLRLVRARPDRYTRYLKSLLAQSPDYPYRDAWTTLYKKCADWAAAEILQQELGFPEVEVVPVSVLNQGVTYNVIARTQNPLVQKPQRTYTVCAHLDTVSNSPGANDNGSGVAAVFELGAMLKKRAEASNHALQLILFGGEEKGLQGSKAYCAQAYPSTDLVTRQSHRVINLDTIGGKKPSVNWADHYLEYRSDQERRMVPRLLNHAGTLDIVDSDLRTTWVGRLSGTFPQVRASELSSDHLPFQEKRVAAVSISQHPDYAMIHTQQDTIAKMDLGQALAVVDMVGNYLADEFLT